jgi:hypothetical protein
MDRDKVLWLYLVTKTPAQSLYVNFPPSTRRSRILNRHSAAHQRKQVNSKMVHLPWGCMKMEFMFCCRDRAIEPCRMQRIDERRY